MAKTAIATLKAWFETGDIPTQTQFENLIDSFHHKDGGEMITDIDQGANITISLSDGSQLVIPVYTLPDSMPIGFITGLQTALDSFVTKVTGKGLSTEDFTTELKNKLATLKNYVHPETHEISEINDLQTLLNTFAILANLAQVATTGNYEDLINKPTAFLELSTDEAKKAFYNSLQFINAPYLEVGETYRVFEHITTYPNNIPVLKLVVEHATEPDQEIDIHLTNQDKKVYLLGTETHNIKIREEFDISNLFTNSYVLLEATTPFGLRYNRFLGHNLGTLPVGTLLATVAGDGSEMKAEIDLSIINNNVVIGLRTINILFVDNTNEDIKYGLETPHWATPPIYNANEAVRIYDIDDRIRYAIIEANLINSS